MEELKVQNPSVTDLINLAKFKEEQAKEALEQGDNSTHAVLLHQKEELHQLVHLIVKEASFNTTGLEMSKFRSTANNSLTFNANILSEESKQLKINFDYFGEDIKKIPQHIVSRATEQSKKYVNAVLDDIPLKFKKFDTDPQDIQAQILSRRNKKKENPMVSGLRNTICRLIAQGKRHEAVDLVRKLVLRFGESDSYKTAHEFISAVKEQFNVNEPPKNPRKTGENIPEERWIYAEYKIRETDEEKKEKGFLKRREDSINMYDIANMMKCHTIDVEKWRLATNPEIKGLNKTQVPF